MAEQVEIGRSLPPSSSTVGLQYENNSLSYVNPNRHTGDQETHILTGVSTINMKFATESTESEDKYALSLCISP